MELKTVLKDTEHTLGLAITSRLINGDVNGADPYPTEEGGFLLVDSWETVERIKAIVVEMAEEMLSVTLSVEELDFDDVTRFLGWEWGFSDEYTICAACAGPIHIIPTHYGDLPDYFRAPDNDFCGPCVRQDPEDYLEFLTNNSRAANTILEPCVLEDEGFCRMDAIYESGLHEGQCDEPSKIFDQLDSEGYDVIFSVIDAGQFDMRWQAWVRKR
jgi:hypothetical protein